MEEIVIECSRSNYLSMSDEVKLFGSAFKGRAIKISKNGILFQTFQGFKTSMLKAKKCRTRGNARYLTFDSEEIEKFKSNWVFMEQASAVESSKRKEAARLLEAATDVRILVSKDARISSTHYRGASGLLDGYLLMDVLACSDIAVPAVRSMFRKSQKKKDEIKRDFDKEMKKRGFSRKY